jgi:hypothetical protein
VPIASPPPTQTQSPGVTGTQTSTPEQSSASNHTLEIALGVALPLLFILLVILGFLYLRKSRNAKRTKKDSSVSNVAQILDKRYICIVDFEPVASDELKLRAGDVVVLDLLFNDGWSKGKNGMIW